MKKSFKWIWYALWLLIALVGGGGTLFSWMPRTPGMFYGGIAMLVVSVTLGTMLVLVARGKEWKKAWLPGVIAGVVYAAIVAIVVYVCDELIFKNCVADYQPVHSSITVVVLNLVLMLASVVFIPKKYDPKLHILKRIVALALVATAFVLSGLPQNWWWGRYNYKVQASKWVTTPAGFSSFTETEYGLVEDADFYVAVDGDDNNDGSIEKPFATIEKARNAVRAMDKSGKTGITVAVKAGEYRIGSLVFTAEDSGTEECPITYCAYGDGEVILTAGVTLNPADFEAVTDEQAERLSSSARKNVVCIDLSKYGITAEDYGALHVIGKTGSADKYDGDYTGAANCELFVNNTRQTIARYPNEGWLTSYEVLDHGEPWETVENPHVKVEGWLELRNPRGNTLQIEKDLADRINGWSNLNEVWVFNYFTADWYPTSTPISDFNYEDRTLSTKFVAIYSVMRDMPHYFYNVYEELDTEGEWYLDRENGILYLYKTEAFDTARITLSLSTEVMLQVENANYLTFRGFSMEGTRSDAMKITGNNNTVEICLIHNVSGSGIVVDGYNNLIFSNEITQVEGSPVKLYGGDVETLTPANNRVYNNYIHDWTGGNGTSGIRIYGVGHHVSHNELHNTGDSAIEYDGNDHIIEYNLIYNVCLESSDGGAIYSGRSWNDYGCVVRYNAIYNVGQPGFSTPNGIYLDDGLSGQQIYCNLIVNAPQNGVKLGGGRDNEIWGNIIVNTVENGIYGIEAVYYGSMPSNVYDSLKPNWENSPKDTPIWQEAYPELAKTFWDESKLDDPYFVANPANNKVNGNILVNINGELGEIDPSQAKFSDFSGNAVYTLDMLEAIFVDPANGDYRLKEDSVIYDIIPDFEAIPFEKIGRE